MRYQEEVEAVLKEFGTNKFSISEINSNRLGRGEKPLTKIELITFVSVLKKRYSIRTSYIYKNNYTKTFFELREKKIETQHRKEEIDSGFVVEEH